MLNMWTVYDNILLSVNVRTVKYIIYITIILHGKYVDSI